MLTTKHYEQERHKMADEKHDAPEFDPSQLPPFDPSKFDPSKFDPSMFDPSKFDPSKFPGFDPSKFDPSKFSPPPFDDGPEEETTEDDNILKQEDPAKWLRQPPKKMRGNTKNAFKFGREAEKYKCTCWNKRCPFYGNCRQCIVFHMALKQLPTCQRDMVIEMYKEGYLAEELYIDDEVKPKE